MLRNFLFFALALTLILCSCNREEEFSITSTTSFPESVELVNTDLAGLVRTDDGSAAENAMVSIRTNNQLVTTTTDELGFFVFTDVTVPKDGALVRVDIPGYLPGIRRVSVPSVGTPHTTIQVKRAEEQSFSTSEGNITATYANDVRFYIIVVRKS